MTYSPLLPASVHSLDSFDNSPARAWSASLLGQMSCLLHCPTDMPKLWPKVLLLLGRELSSSVHLSWRTAPGGGIGEQHCWGISDLSTADSARLWRHLDLDLPDEEATLWQIQPDELKAQLSTFVFEDCVQLTGARVYERDCWPAEVVAALGPSAGRTVALLPLCHETNGVGVLCLLRRADQARWNADEIELLEAVGRQIYLAIWRSHIDYAKRNRSACDQLTQLPDRVLFNQQLSRAIAFSNARDTMLGVAFLDLDRFKNINDTLGHEAGDCLLQQVAERLQESLRVYDVVARWGGDEFTLMLPGLRSAEDITHIAERILKRLAAPFQVQDQELFVTASLGIALSPYDGRDGQTLLRNADAAMYQAKSRGRNNFQVYFEEINADARNQLNLETDLRKALDNHELFLCYQPQVDLATGEWIGLEALIRWQHPVLGLIPPGRFISIAEETGLIEPIGQWVLQEACAQYGRWREKGFPALRLAVNLSAQQFQRGSLVRSVMNILKSTNFDPCYLELEVTESAAMHDVKFAIELLKELSRVGIQIAMDDFGTGYSSLSVLKHFPLDTIKIDRSFVMDLVDSPSDAAIASTIIALAKGLNFKVLAEGIETADQIAVLSDMGCDYAQGYWYSRPLGVEQIDVLLEDGTFFQVAKLPQP